MSRTRAALLALLALALLLAAATVGRVHPDPQKWSVAGRAWTAPAPKGGAWI